MFSLISQHQKLLLKESVQMVLKKWRVGLLSAVVGVAALFVGISDTSAATYKYDGKSPVSTHCDDTGVVKSSKSFSNSRTSGKVYLMYSTKCKTAWAYVKLNKKLQSKYRVTGVVHRNNDGKISSCNGKGGNGYIVAGQTSCYSGMVYDYKPNTSYAQAITSATTNPYEIHTSDKTASY
jgi:hypothetical protein